jgi:hypothetical protein
LRSGPSSFGTLFGPIWTFWNESCCLTGLIVCTCRVKKRKRGKKQRAKERGGENPNVFVKGSLLPFTKKIPCPTQVWGGCNEEETVRDKERKERKQSTVKKARDKTKYKRTENKPLGRDRQTCGTFTLRCCGCCLFVY